MIAGNKIITQLGKIGNSISSDRDRTLAKCLLKIALRNYRAKLMNNQPNHKNRIPQETPCPICGSQNFVWGRTGGRLRHRTPGNSAIATCKGGYAIAPEV